MKVWTYRATEDDAPDGIQFVARIQHSDGTMHPVVFAGADLAMVQARAEAWWALELAKAEAASRRGANLRHKPAAASDAPASDSMDDAELIVL